MSSAAPSSAQPASLSGDPPLAHQIAIRARSARLSLEGELDLVSQTQFGLLLDRCSTAALVVVDLRAVTFMSCGVLRRLLAAARHTRAMGGRFVVVAGHGPVQRLFDLVGVEGEFEVAAASPDFEGR